MLRKRIIALLAAATVGMVAPGVAFAGHGGGSGHGSGHSGGWSGGSSGGWSGRSSGWTGNSSGWGRSGQSFASSNFRGDSIRGGDTFRNGGSREGFRGDRFRRGDRDGDFGFGAFAFGFGYPYDYYGYPYYDDYAYADTYYDDGGCYIVRRRVSTPYGWRIRPVRVCG
jgi:hypothetical protein